MIEGPMPCPSADLPDLFRLLDRVFRPTSRPGTMAAQYPLFLTPANRENLRVIKDDGRVVSHVGLGVFDVVLLGARVRVACVGAVCTDDWARGRGHASALVQDAIAHARTQGCSLMLVSGGRDLYRRAGCIGGDVLLRGDVPADPRAASFGLAARWHRPDVPGLVRVHQTESVRFVRPSDHWERLLAKAQPNGCCVETYVVGSGGEVVAYVCCQPDRRKDYLPVIEYGGSRMLVCGMASDLACRSGRVSAELTIQPGDMDLVAVFRASRYALSPRPFPGTFRLIDIPAFLGSVSALLEERVGRTTWQRLAIDAGEDAVAWRLGGETIEWRGVPEVTERVFVDPVQGAHDGPLCAALTRMFPLPLPWYGLNYC